jgi:hypothetical protein
MTVKELITKLVEVDPDSVVVAWTPHLNDYEEVTGIHSEGKFVWINTDRVDATSLG